MMSLFACGRSWRSNLALSGVLLALAAVHGCGGGTTVASLPGTGGTGYTSVGTITGFGSVKVNGVFFNDTTASVTIDGQSQNAAALGLGMLVTVQGRGVNLWSARRDKDGKYTNLGGKPQVAAP